MKMSGLLLCITIFTVAKSAHYTKLDEEKSTSHKTQYEKLLIVFPAVKTVLIQHDISIADVNAGTNFVQAEVCGEKAISFRLHQEIVKIFFNEVEGGLVVHKVPLKTDYKTEKNKEH